jgi:uncharacterized protein DUF4365
MKKADNALIERAGVNAVNAIFTEQFKWFFREQPLLDWGIDAQVEQIEGGAPTGKLFALQIKTGASYFKKQGQDYVYYGDMKHLDYWSGHSLPVYLILHHPETKLTLWQRVTWQACTIHDKGWSIVIPAANVLDAEAKQHFEMGIPQDDEGARRLRFALDRELMEKIGQGEVYFVWENWVNKSLGLRNLKIYVDHNPTDVLADKQEPHFHYDNMYLLTHDVALAMSTLFPWVKYAYAEEIEEDTECEEHILVGHLSDAAKGYLAAEQFFRDGPDWDPPEPTYQMSEHDEFMAALEEDWAAEEAENYRRARDNAAKEK